MAITSPPHVDHRTDHKRTPDWIFHERRGDVVTVHRHTSYADAHAEYSRLMLRDAEQALLSTPPRH